MLNTARHVIPIHARHVLTVTSANWTFGAEVENMWRLTHGWRRRLRRFPSSNRRPTWLKKRWFPSSPKSGGLLVEHVNKVALYASLGWFPNTRVGHQCMRMSNNTVERRYCLGDRFTEVPRGGGLRRQFINAPWRR